MITLGGWLGALMALANTGHLFSPMVLLAIRPDLRQAAARDWGRHFVFPALAFGAAFVLPLTWGIALYGAWNVYHYAMQHNGFWALTKWRGRTRDQRLTLRAVWLGITVAAIHSLPSLMAPVSVFHWLGDIGLSAAVARQWAIFLVLVVLLSMVGLVLMRHDLRAAFPVLVQARIGLGFVHFIVSGLVWPRAALHSATA